MCIYVTSSFQVLFNSVDLWTQTNIDDILSVSWRSHVVTVVTPAKYLVYFHVALDRQKKVSLIVLRIS